MCIEEVSIKRYGSREQMELGGVFGCVEVFWGEGIVEGSWRPVSRRYQKRECL